MSKLTALVALTLAVACADAGLVEPEPDTLAEPDVSPDAVLADGLASSGEVVEMVTGSGHFVTQPPALVPGNWRTFSMTATKTADGSVKGSFQRVVHPTGGGPAEVLHGTITCFTIIGNTVWVGGHREDYDPTDVAWQVVDNGQGSGDPPDLVGLHIEAALWGYPGGFAEEFCETTPTELDFGPYGILPLSVLLTPVKGGNVQITVR